MPRVALVSDQKVKADCDREVRELKHRLSDAGITQAELAKKIGKKQQAISYQFQKSEQMSLVVFHAAQMALEGKI